MNKRSSGVLMHITSLPGKYGTGGFGIEAYDFVDFLFETKQQIWQILPLGHTGYGDSPYQCYSAFAGNPLLIDVDKLIENGLLDKNDTEKDIVFDESALDTEKVAAFKEPLFRKAIERFHALDTDKNDYASFCEKNSYWLNDYALFMALKQKFGQAPWTLWENDIKMRNADALEKYTEELHADILYIKTLQFFFYSQWLELKSYANTKGIAIFGDIPLYVAYDSVDAWANAELFLFDSDKNPIAVAGVPPDYFSETGQLWGNPLYNWSKHIATNFEWWLSRIEANFVLYDILRIDHFRGLSAFWSVPYGEETAINGQWEEAPGQQLFETVFAKFGKVSIIAEDLGVITKDVEQLRDGFGLPGMKVLHFAFDGTPDNDFLPHTYLSNCVVYTGTHDNDTTLGWYKSLTEEEKLKVHTYFNFKSENVSQELIRLAWMSVAEVAIAPMQDLLNLDTDARMNLPGIPTGYWKWRMKQDAITDAVINTLKTFTKIYGRALIEVEAEE